MVVYRRVNGQGHRKEKTKEGDRRRDDESHQPAEEDALVGLGPSHDYHPVASKGASSQSGCQGVTEERSTTKRTSRAVRHSAPVADLKRTCSVEEKGGGK